MRLHFYIQGVRNGDEARPKKNNMNRSEILEEKVKKIAQSLLKGSRRSHNWEHTIRVVGLCRRFGLKKGADMDVLLTSAYLHDIGRDAQDSSKGLLCHAKEGARIALPIVKQLPLSEEQRKNIIHSIRTHRFRGNHIPETIEAKLLYDADKLDALGAVGVARAFLFAGELGARLHNPDIRVEDAVAYSKDDTGYREYRLKLCKIKEKLLTDEGKEMALGRHLFMENFFVQFLKEYKGEV